MTIQTVDELIGFCLAIPDSDRSLFSFALKRKVNENPQNALEWYKRIEAQEQHRGEIHDFTTRQIGEVIVWMDNQPIKACPICGRNGLVNDDPQYIQSTYHIVSVLSGMACEIVDQCKFGDKWGEFE